MHEPDILFLDEPTSGVDPITRREFWLHINSMVEKGVTVMVTTHFMDEAEYCDRIGLVYRGKLIAHGTPDDLKTRPPTTHSQTRPWSRRLSPSSTTGIRRMPMHSNAISWRRVRALCIKETRQIVRDPSSWLIAVVIPLLLLFIFGYGINLDSSKLRVGILLEQQSEEALLLLPPTRLPPPRFSPPRHPLRPPSPNPPRRQSRRSPTAASLTPPTSCRLCGGDLGSLADAARRRPGRSFEPLIDADALLV